MKITNWRDCIRNRSKWKEFVEKAKTSLKLQCLQKKTAVNVVFHDVSILRICKWFFIVVVIVIIIIIFVITFIQGIYNYIPETNHVSRVYCVAAVLYLQLVLHVMLFHPWNKFCIFTLAFSTVCVPCPIWLFFEFFNFVLSQYIAQVLSKWFWNGCIHPFYCWFIIITTTTTTTITTSCWRPPSTTQQFSFSLLWGIKCQNVTLKGQSHSWFCWMRHTTTHTTNCLSYTFMRKVCTNDLLYLQSIGLQGLPVTYNKIRHTTQHSLALITWNSKFCHCWWPARCDYTTAVLVLTTYSKDVAPERQHESLVINTL